MRTRVSVTAAICLSAAFVCGIANAQAPQSPVLYVNEIHVSPGNIPAYETAIKGLLKAWNTANLPFPVNALTAEDGRYVFAVVLNSFSDMEKMNAISSSSAVAPAMAKVQAASESTTSWLVQSRPDLSYTPANPRLQPEEVQFIHFISLHLQRDKVDAAENLAKKVVDLVKGNNGTDAFETYTSITGADGPTITFGISAKSIADYYNEDEAVQAAIGEELGALQAQFGAISRSIEIINATIRPDLSYTPGG